MLKQFIITLTLIYLTVGIRGLSDKPCVAGVD